MIPKAGSSDHSGHQTNSSSSSRPFSPSCVPASAVRARRPSLSLTRYGSFSRESSTQNSRQPSPERHGAAPVMSEASIGAGHLQVNTSPGPDSHPQPQEPSLRRAWTKSTEHLVYKGPRDSRRFSTAFESDNGTDFEEHEALLGVVDPDATTPGAGPHPAAAAGLQSQAEETPYGVQKIQAVTARLRRKDLKSLYLALYLLMFTTALEASTTPVVEPYFLSSFHLHSLLASMGILTNIGVALIRPLMAKMLDIFGRAEGIALAAVLYCCGYMMISASQSVVVFAIAKTIASFGAQGLHLSLSVLIADTTSLSNRALVSSTTSIPWFLTIWIGPPLGQFFLSAGDWGYRTSYAFFAILIPLLCLPLIYGLHRTFRRITKAAHHRFASGASYFSEAATEDYHQDTYKPDIVVVQPQSWSTLFRACREQLDLVGILLLCAGGILILLPLSLSASKPKSWEDVRISGSIILGILALWAFVKHETVTTKPFMPRRLLDNRTIRAGCLLGCFHFICQFTYESYFTSFLQVSRNLSARDAQYIQESYLFAAVLSGIVCGLAAKYSRRYKRWGVLGVLIHMVGCVMMVRFRKITNPLWEIVAGQIIGGIGGGLTTAASQLGIQATVNHLDLAMATAVLLAVTQVGAAIGASVSGAVWTSVLPNQLRAHLPVEQHGMISDIMGSLSYALSFEPGTAEREAISASYGRTQYVLNLISLISLLPALLSMLRMQSVHLTDDRSADAVVVMGRADQLHDEDSV